MTPGTLNVFQHSELICDFVLSAAPCRVGRHPSNEILLAVPEISAHHALIVWEGDCLIISDLHSQNGTQLNGEVVTKGAVVANGDIVTLPGGVSLHFSLNERLLGSNTPFPKTDLAAEPFVLPCIQVALQGGPGPIAVLYSESQDLRVELRATNRAVMLFLLAQQRKSDLEKGMPTEQAGWMNDEVLRGEIWGITRKTMGTNNLQVLLFRTRQQLEKAGMNGWIVEKRARHTRLNLKSIEILAVFHSQ
jgi:hypothetical protein